MTHHLIGVALSMLLIGLFLMVTRKKAITQILALLTVENAVFLVAVGVTTGMPLVVELGIAFDVILAVLVLGILVQRIVDRFESMDVSRLSKLERIGVNLLVWTLAVPLLTAAIGGLGGPRRFKEATMAGGLALTFGPVPCHGESVPGGCERRPPSARRCASTGCRRWCSSCAALSAALGRLRHRLPAAQRRARTASRRGCGANSTA